MKVGNAPKSGGKLPPDVVAILKDPDTKRKFLTLPVEQQVAWAWRMRWLQQAHRHQILPAGDWYSVWLLLAGRGAGKQLCVDTLIPTPTGWVRNGDLKDGDVVFDERGNICSVVQAHPISMPKTAYRLTFNDGSVIDADGEHLWSTMTHRARRQMTRHGIKRVPDDWATYRHPIINCHQTVMGYVGSEVLTTQQIKGTLTQGIREDLNHCIPTAQPLNLPDAVLPVDPYLLGSWLGDGSSKEQAIWGHAEDIGLIESYAQSLGYETVRKQSHGNTWSIRVLGLAKQLKSLGVLGNKHVPWVYLRASLDQRLALLQGLMDTDGYQDAKLAEFCNTNQKLANAVYELAVSLGEKPVIKESRAKLNGRDCGEKYRVTWRWNRFNPFRMERKRNRLAAPEGQSFKHGHRMIVSVEEIDPKPMRCITVDSPSRLYLAGEAMIPTHNTRTAAEQVGWMAWTNPGTRTLVAAPTSSDVRSTCFEGDSGLMSVIPSALVSDYNKALHEIRLINGSLIKGIPASEPERFRGPQFHFAWADELAAWEYLQEAWDQIQFGLRLGKRTIMICTTTPRPKDLIIDLIGRDGDDVAVTTASTYTNLDNLSANFRKQILQYEGTTLGRQEIYAEIIDPEESGIVKRDMFKLWPNGKPFPKFEYIIQSYDVATSEKAQNDPTACITFGVFKPLDGPMAVMVIDCWQERLQYPDLRPRVIDEYGAVYGEGKEKKRVDLLLIEDKSAGISLIQDLQRAHLPIRAYNPGRADKMQRLNIVSNIIARGRVWIPESSTRKGYVRDWAEGFVSQICSFPESTHDDFVDSCVDSLTQILMADGVKAIKDVQVGDMVMTPAGPRRVTAVHDNGIKGVWYVNGLLATAEHRVMTQFGWTRVDALTQGVHNVYLNKEALWGSSQLALRSSLWSSMAGRTVDILRVTTRRTGGILRGLATACTETFGFITTGLSRQASTFTTLTGTLPTTTSAIWPASQRMSTGQSTGYSDRSEAEARSNLLCLIESDRVRRLGTDRQKALSGTSSTPKPLWPRLGESLGFGWRSLSNASGAALRACARAIAGCTAVPPARTPNHVSVSVSRVTNTHTMRHVFDLTVEGEHCYYAEGMLVHNCTQALRFLRDSGWLDIDPPPDDDWDEDDYVDSGRSRQRENPYAQ